jgi:hypothetical protein
MTTKPDDWPAIEWEDGCPVDEEFDDYAGLPIDIEKAGRFLLCELPEAAENCCASCEVTDSVDALERPVKRIAFSTGGWSGAESLIGFIESRFDTKHLMVSWRRGGHYLFEVPASPEAQYPTKENGSG